MAIMSFENTKGKKLLKEDANYSKEQKEALQELQQLNDYWSSEIMKFHLQACLEDEAEKLRNPLSPKSFCIWPVHILCMVFQKLQCCFYYFFYNASFRFPCFYTIHLQSQKK